MFLHYIQPLFILTVNRVPLHMFFPPSVAYCSCLLLGICQAGDDGKRFSIVLIEPSTLDRLCIFRSQGWPFSVVLSPLSMAAKLHLISLVWDNQSTHTCPFQHGGLRTAIHFTWQLWVSKESFKRPRGTPQQPRNVISAHSVGKADHESWLRLQGKRTVLSLSVGGVAKPMQPSLISHIYLNM